LENPYISASAIEEMRADMTATAFAQEIMAEDRDDAPGALWRREVIDAGRFKVAPDDAGIIRTVIAVDPSATSGGDECGIMAGSYGETYQHFYVEGDYSVYRLPPLNGRRRRLMRTTGTRPI
jgi:phage terminase large subunit-like protein